MEDSGGLEEERRLAYVGITRAMKKLVLTYAESRRMYGNENFNAISRFVREIPKQLVEEVRINTTVTRPSSYSTSPLLTGTTSTEGFSLGQSVYHPIFGDGVILQFEGQGPSARVQVNFSTEGTKWLVLQYAKLEAI